ncbi:hypothetical protein [Rhodoplanes sp. Z2-YC6860]|uniref:hypothetical protein n=1 Tax=Rhodoplanes sp. Z2-YC6860 TaxID=674703 RepID=UPI0012EDCBEC|nr:hypothetical protein [Rhodoplanes sp. Z2-YC6860]
MSAHEQNTYFDDQALAAMIVAYDRACCSLRPLGLTPIVREIIGQRIIEAARQGERDPELLHQQALATLGIEKTANVLAA